MSLYSEKRNERTKIITMKKRTIAYVPFSFGYLSDRNIEHLNPPGIRGKNKERNWK